MSLHWWQRCANGWLHQSARPFGNVWTGGRGSPRHDADEQTSRDQQKRESQGAWHLRGASSELGASINLRQIMEPCRRLYGFLWSVPAGGQHPDPLHIMLVATQKKILTLAVIQQFCWSRVLYHEYIYLGDYVG